MTDRVIFRDTRIRDYLIALLVLLTLLLTLLFLYYALTRPAQLVGDKPPEDEEFQFLFSIYGFEGDLLHRPSGVHIGPDERIYVADTGKNRIVIFDNAGEYINSISGQNLDDYYAFKYPISVAVAEDGRIYALSKQDRKIVVFDRNYQPVDIIKFPNLLPTAVHIKGDRLYVTTDRAIMVGTLEGDPVRQIGMLGKGKGQFDLPGGLTVDDNGIIYVADSLNYRVQAIDSKTGEAKWIYGEPLPPDEALKFRGPERKFGLPASIALDETGRLYIVDGTNSEIVVLDSQQGEYIRDIGEIGHTDGRFYYPDGVSYGEGGYVAVADKFNDRVGVYRVPVPDVPPLVPRWLPWLALLPFILLLLWLLLRRGAKFVAAEDSISLAIEKEYLEELPGSIKKLYVTPATFDVFKDRFENSVSTQLVKVEPDEAKLKEIKENFNLDDRLSEVLTIAYQLKGKKALLVETKSVREAADQLGIANMDLTELMSSQEVSQKPVEESR